jgi:hypothetical protein
MKDQLRLIAKAIWRHRYYQSAHLRHRNRDLATFLKDGPISKRYTPGCKYLPRWPSEEFQSSFALLLHPRQDGWSQWHARAVTFFESWQIWLQYFCFSGAIQLQAGCAHFLVPVISVSSSSSSCRCPKRRDSIDVGMLKAKIGFLRSHEIFPLKYFQELPITIGTESHSRRVRFRPSMPKRWPEPFLFPLANEQTSCGDQLRRHDLNQGRRSKEVYLCKEEVEQDHSHLKVFQVYQ